MKLSDDVWRLNRTEGISKGTLAAFTRGDSQCDEVFATEREAWLAEAERADAEASSYARRVEHQRKRAADARKNAAQCMTADGVAR